MKEEYKPLKKCFERNEWEWDDDPQVLENISVKVNGDLYLYNYKDCVLVERDHPTIKKCRGIVIDKNGHVVNYPFQRFFNAHEKECDVIDWDSAVMFEKQDGSLCCVWNYLGEWHVTTRGAFYNHDLHDVNFSDEFKRLFPKESWDLLHENYCYMFELVSKKNPIVTKYDDEFVSLLAMKEVSSLEEVSPDVVERVAKELKVCFPSYTSVQDIEECKKYLESLRDDEEGVVVVDKNFNRMKLKQESYIRLSRIKNLSEDDVFDYVLGKTEIDEEYLSVLPEVQETINVMRSTLDYFETMVLVLYDDIVEQVNQEFSHPTRKDFALKAKEFPFSGVLFCLYDDKDYTNILCWEKVMKWSENFE